MRWSGRRWKKGDDEFDGRCWASQAEGAVRSRSRLKQAALPLSELDLGKSGVLP